MKYALTTLVLATLAAGDCAADNCLRALRATQVPGRLGDARDFCATFTVGSVAATAIPSYAVDACKQNQNGPLSVRLSSACNCIAATSTSSLGPSVTAPPSNTTSATSISVTPTSASVSASLTEACALVSSSSSVQRAASPSCRINTLQDQTNLTISQLPQLWLPNWLTTA